MVVLVTSSLSRLGLLGFAFTDYQSFDAVCPRVVGSQFSVNLPVSGGFELFVFFPVKLFVLFCRLSPSYPTSVLVGGLVW